MAEKRRDLIETSINDLVSNFLYYDRKEDEELPRGSIQEAIAAGEISVEEIVATFNKELREGLGEVTGG